MHSLWLLLLTLLAAPSWGQNTCIDIFEAPLVAVRSEDIPLPSLHAGTAGAFFQNFLWPTRAVVVDTVVFKEGYQYRLHVDLPPFYLSRRYYEDGQLILEMTPLMGTNRYFFRVGDRNETTTLYPAYPPRDAVMPLVTSTESSFLKALEVWRGQEPVASPRSEMQRFILAESMALAQSTASMSLSKSKNPDGVEMNSLIEANQRMLKLLDLGMPLTREVLEHLHRVLLTTSLEGFNRVLAGIVRGSPERVVTYEGESYPVNLSELQIYNGPRHMRFNYLPAGEVPRRLDQWLRAVQAIDRRTSVREIALLYREFIVIHPFVDGNGRTSRLMLDYMILKGGLPRLDHSLVTREVLFKSEDQLYVDLMKAMLGL